MDIEALARALALEDGIGPRTWAASDECVRLHYRREAAKLSKRSACPSRSALGGEP